MSLFDSLLGSLTEEAVNEATQSREPLLFTAGVGIDFRVIDVSENSTKGYILVKAKVLSEGEHVGKVHYLFFSGKSKSSVQDFIRFLAVYFTKEEIINRKMDITAIVNSKITVIFRPVEKFQGKNYQHVASYTLVETGKQVEPEFNNQDIPF